MSTIPCVCHLTRSTSDRSSRIDARRDIRELGRRHRDDPGWPTRGVEGAHRIMIAALAPASRSSSWKYVGLLAGPNSPRSNNISHELNSACGCDWCLPDRVRFMGERSDVAGAICAPPTCTASRTCEPEAVWISLVEALAAGLPVVTSGIGGACEIVDETCGVSDPSRGCRRARGGAQARGVRRRAARTPGRCGSRSSRGFVQRSPADETDRAGPFIRHRPGTCRSNMNRPFDPVCSWSGF